MKKTLLVLFAILFCFSSNGQSSKNFFDFIKSYNWDITETAFKAKYADRFIPVDTLMGMPVQKSYILNDLKVGEYDCSTFISFADTTPGMIVGSLNPNPIISLNPGALADKIDRIVDQNMIDPADAELEDVPLSTFGVVGLDSVKGVVRIWMMEETGLISIKMMTDSTLAYVFIAKKEEPREPDFRKGRWGDSMSECKKKEGKSDELGMDGIYAFRTYVAGHKVVAAYRFTNDRLTSGKYIFTDENAINCVNHYSELVSYLTQKYGEPSIVNKDYSPTTSSTDKRVFTEGELVRQNKLEMGSIWVTPFSTIFIYLKGGEYGSISLSLEYTSNKFDKTVTKSILNDL